MSQTPPAPNTHTGRILSITGPTLFSVSSCMSQPLVTYHHVTYPDRTIPFHPTALQSKLHPQPNNHAGTRRTIKYVQTNDKRDLVNRLRITCGSGSTMILRRCRVGPLRRASDRPPTYTGSSGCRHCTSVYGRRSHRH